MISTPCPYQVLEEQLIYENKYIRLTNERIEDEHGNTFTYSMITRPHSKQIVAVLVLTETELVLIEQYRIPHHDWIVEAVAGVVDVWYSLEETVQKECLEEVGCLVSSDRIIHLGKVVTSSWLTNEVVDLFVAIDAMFVWRQDSGELAECITTVKVPLADVMSVLMWYISTGKVLDPKIMSMILLGAAKGVPWLQKIVKWVAS